MKHAFAIRVHSALAFYAVFFCNGVASANDLFRAGASAVDVTPTTFPVIVNGGFLEKKATKVNDPLFARAIVLDDGTTRLAVCVVDTCMMTREIIDRAKDLAARSSGIPTERMLVSATHTHSAASAMACLGTSLDANYEVLLPGKIAEAIEAATKNLATGRVGWTSVPAWKYTNCRRWIRRPEKIIVDPFGVASARANMHPGYQNPDAIGPSGPIDPDLSLLALQTRDGRPLALLANFSMHYFGAAAISADYFGKFAAGIGKQIGADDSSTFVGIMSQGTSGDSQWMDYSQPKSNLSIDQYSAGLLEIAAAAYQKIEFHDFVSLAMAETTLKLNRRVADQDLLKRSSEIVKEMKSTAPFTTREVYAREQLLMAAEPVRELKLQAVCIGELGITAIPNEVYAITGLKLKGQSPLPATFNIELANGSEGYIPPPEQHALGGYTTWPARTAGLERNAEPRIVETVLTLLEQVSGKKRRAMIDEHGPYAKAVLDAKPLAYWRMNEIAPPTAFDSSGNGNHGVYSSELGVAFYLLGVGNSMGASSQPSLACTAFSGPNQINRAPHFAGGNMGAKLLDLDADYTVTLWLWNGLDPQVREIAGIAFRRGDELFGVMSKSGTPGRLFLSPKQSAKRMFGTSEVLLRDWHHVALVRKGTWVEMYLDGKPELSGDVAQKATAQYVSIAGANGSDDTWQGKLDEVAVFNRVLTAKEIAAQYETSGPPPRAPVAKPQ